MIKLRGNGWATQTDITLIMFGCRQLIPIYEVKDTFALIPSIHLFCWPFGCLTIIRHAIPKAMTENEKFSTNNNTNTRLKV